MIKPLTLSRFQELCLTDGRFECSPSRWSLAIIWTSLIGIALLARSIHLDRKRRGGLPLPPGPKGLPILGNLLQMDQEYQWLLYKKWGKEYGDIVYVEIMGQPMLILNSLQRAIDLLDKRAAKFSDRPPVPAYELMGFNEWLFGLKNYGPSWRTYRRDFHQNFNQHAVRKYQPVIESETLVFLRHLLDRPEMFLEETHTYFGSTIMRVAYGFNDFSYNEALFHEAEVIMQGFSEGVMPGRFLVNSFPFLRHLPSWFPGTSWKKRFEEIAIMGRDVVDRPYNDVKERMREGHQNPYPDAASSLMDQLPPETDPNFVLRNKIAGETVANAYLGGSDTTVSSAHALFLALAMHPQVQLRVQEEIERVVGKDKLPTPEDCSQLPYLQAVIKELGRWHTVAPVAFPHVAAEDDEYMGYFIPKGTVVFSNTWGILHDPEVFKDPFEFNPERYLKDGKINPSVLDPGQAAFGYGRRICPGRHFSNEALTYMAAGLLTVFELKPPKDELGNPVPLKLEVGTDLICKPLPFKCEIVPRSQRHVALLTESTIGA